MKRNRFFIFIFKKKILSSSGQGKKGRWEGLIRGGVFGKRRAEKCPGIQGMQKREGVCCDKFVMYVQDSFPICMYLMACFEKRVFDLCPSLSINSILTFFFFHHTKTDKNLTGA